MSGEGRHALNHVGIETWTKIGALDILKCIGHDQASCVCRETRRRVTLRAGSRRDLSLIVAQAGAEEELIM